MEEKTNSNPSHSSGVGVWGRGASLREAASPPESPVPPQSFREGARGRGPFFRKAPSLASSHFFNFQHDDFAGVEETGSAGGVRRTAADEKTVVVVEAVG